MLYRELSLLCAASENYTDVTYLRQSLHNVPEKLRAALQAEISSIDGGADAHTTYPPYGKPFDAILLGFGLCSNAIEGLTSKTHSLVVPRAHDCIALFLGSAERYARLSGENTGTYWYTRGWIENTSMPGPERRGELLTRYRERYGAGKAEKLTAAAEEWQSGYASAMFIGSDLFDCARSEAYSKACAEYIGWKHGTISGSSGLLRDFVEGSWDEERFLIVPPGKRVVLTYDDKIFTAAD